MDLAKFFSEYRKRLGRLSLDQVEALKFLLVQLAKLPPDGLREAAYMLATVKHETADTYQPVREAFWLSEAWRKKHLRYWPWYGRGFVQLTWEDNYRQAGERLGEDLTTDPDRVMEPHIAYAIMLHGMREGWFTGKQLSDYITEHAADYRGARRIINGTDKAHLIAGYADKFEAALKAAGYPV